MVRLCKDSSSEIYVGLMVTNHCDGKNKTLVQLLQLVPYMAQQHCQGSREKENQYQGVELLSHNQTSAFLGRENHLGHKNVLWRSHWTFFNP